MAKALNIQERKPIDYGDARILSTSPSASSISSLASISSAGSSPSRSPGLSRSPLRASPLRSHRELKASSAAKRPGWHERARSLSPSPELPRMVRAYSLSPRFSPSYSSNNLDRQDVTPLNSVIVSLSLEDVLGSSRRKRRSQRSPSYRRDHRRLLDDKLGDASDSDRSISSLGLFRSTSPVPLPVLNDFDQTLKDVSSLLQKLPDDKAEQLFPMDEDTQNSPKGVYSRRRRAWVKPSDFFDQSKDSSVETDISTSESNLPPQQRKTKFKTVKFDQDALSVVLPFTSHAPPANLLDNDQCMAYPDPGDAYIEAMKEKQRMREEEDRSYVHGVVVHNWKPPQYQPTTIVVSNYQIIAPFNFDRGNVKVEDIRLRARSVVGITIVVKNLAFNKKVFIRYSLDRWQTTEEVEAKYVEKLYAGDDSWDKYLADVEVPTEIFKIDISQPDSVQEEEEDPMRGTAGGRMQFAAGLICYGVGEFWDNNGGRNFEVEFRRRKRQQPLAKGLTGGSSTYPSMAWKRDVRKDRVKKKQEEWSKVYGFE